MTLHSKMISMGDRAVIAAREMAKLSAKKKNSILEAMADEITAQKETIQAANARDVSAGREAGLSAAMLDRLELTDARIDAMVKGLLDVAALKDPVGTTISDWNRPNGLQIKKVRVPIGVIAIIYESRPNVTADAASLCFKTANAVILRGGKEAAYSNAAIAKAMREGGAEKGMPDNAIQLVETPDRNAVRELAQMVGKVDLIIPRGGEGLIKAVSEMAWVPVIKHCKGICHTFVDAAADIDMALDISENAKCHRPGVCNAMETLLVHRDIAAAFLPRMIERFKARGVELRGDEDTQKFDAAIKPATEEDWTTEYLDMILSIRIVDNVQAAIDHINTYGSHHSDAIVTTDEKAAKAFLAEVDSAAVYVNASTRFTDGGEFGMGAEIGISTDKLHARGPMGLEELTTYKFTVSGTGQIRE
ncbi:MAG: glutamate-5-semialdehyde dehydrogenase [Verrucomicrobiota bacterium]|nr:glutamate-5-semialdehyde dehydrogenase [Verrucomicrobiota bacterium]MDK2964295.1 glutamate-5-semialdehyde dehydrogenase [Verrucomicrobiota bacterium]